MNTTVCAHPSELPENGHSTELDVAIIGGGPVGLAAAHALAVTLPGTRIAVYEKVPQLMRRGAGFAIDVNGQKALHAINPELRDAAEAIGRHLTGFRMYSPDGALFKSMEAAEMLHQTKARYGYCTFLLAWSDLQELLAERLPHGVELHLGQSLDRYEELPDGSLKLHLAGRGPVTTRLLVGADGYFSRIREQCVGDGPPTYAGTAVWRARVRDATSAHHDETGRELCSHSYLGDFRSFMSYPISGSETVWVASVPEAQLNEVGIDQESMRQQKLELSAQAGETVQQNKLVGQAAKERVLKVLDKFPDAIKQMIKDTDDSTIIEHGIYTRSGEDIKPEWFGRGNVVLIGDAAHPMRPTGQGLNQGLEDAYHLAHALAVGGGAAEAELDGFRASRAKRVGPVVVQSFQQGSAAYKKHVGDATKRVLFDDDFNDTVYGISLQPLIEVAANLSAPQAAAVV